MCYFTNIKKSVWSYDMHGLKHKIDHLFTYCNATTTYKAQSARNGTQPNEIGAKPSYAGLSKIATLQVAFHNAASRTPFAARDRKNSFEF